MTLKELIEKYSIGKKKGVIILKIPNDLSANVESVVIDAYTKRVLNNKESLYYLYGIEGISKRTGLDLSEII